MQNNLIVVAIIVALLAGGLGFFGGMKYQERKRPSFSGRVPGELQGQRGQLSGSNGVQGLRPVSGKIIRQDEESITVELEDKSSKIILITENSEINKTEKGTKEDLSEGTEVMVFGQENSDGSLTAQSIQIGTGFFQRPE